MRATRVLIALLPALSIMTATLLASLPWGLPPDSRFVMPFLPFVAIHYWLLRQPHRVPEWLVFACGLGLDVLTNGPLGFWSLIYLVGFAFAHLQVSWDSDTPLSRAILCLVALAVIGLAEWTLSSLYFWQTADWRPLAIAVVWAALSYPLIAVALHLLEVDRPRRINARLERGA
jgi:rod shape-determining protein MreD